MSLAFPVLRLAHLTVTRQAHPVPNTISFPGLEKMRARKGEEVCHQAVNKNTSTKVLILMLFVLVLWE